MTEREREIINPTGQDFERPPTKLWRAEFPYHWDVDDLVSRRELLRFAVYTSGALFVSTAVLSGLGALRGRRATPAQPIAAATQVLEGQALYFHYPDPGAEAMLLHLPGGRFVAYSQTCTHLSCSVFYQPERERLYCPCHEGVFDPLTGEPVAGPPQRRLPRIGLRQEGEMIVATDLVP